MNQVQMDTISAFLAKAIRDIQNEVANAPRLDSDSEKEDQTRALREKIKTKIAEYREKHKLKPKLPPQADDELLLDYLIRVDKWLAK